MSYSAIQVSLNTFIPKTLHAAKVGVGLGLYNLINFFGMAFGPAVASKIMESTNSYRFNFILIVMLISAHFFLLIGMSSFQKRWSIKDVLYYRRNRLSYRRSVIFLSCKL